MKKRKWLSMNCFRRAAILCVALLLAFTASCSKSDGTVTCVSRLEDGQVKEKVRLSDGQLIFRQEPVLYPDGTVEFDGRGVECSIRSYLPPEHSEEVVYSCEEISDFLQCDLIATLQAANVSERCIPKEEDFITHRRYLTEDKVMKTTSDGIYYSFELDAGSIWCGTGYNIYEKSESNKFMHREFYVAGNLEGNFIGGELITPWDWFEEPNSSVGDIPVYVNYRRYPAPSTKDWDQDEFFACFDIAGYTYGVFALDYTQQEFVDVLLAITNHYGAYPSQTAETATAS